MSHWLSKGSGTGSFAGLQKLFLRMLEDGQAVFEGAAAALLGERPVEEVRKTLFDTDARINATEQEMRRKLVVHGTVHGVQSFPSLLVLMSVGKDAERIGDYGKNLFDLAAAGPDLGGRRELLTRLRGEICALLEHTRSVYRSEDPAEAHAYLEEADRIEDTCDRAIDEALAVRGENRSGEALALRYFKRVASHAANVVTSLVMPLDKLDFFDES